MVASSEGNDVLAEELNRQLGEAFGASGGGCINIKALHRLLTSLIELHVRYEAEKQELSKRANNSSGSTLSGGGAASGNSLKTAGGTSSKVVPHVQEVTKVSEIPDQAQSEESSKEKSQANEPDSTPKKTTDEIVPETIDRTSPNTVDSVSEKLDDEEGVALDITPKFFAEKPLEQELLDSKPSSLGDVPTQRSSDFLTKSTTSSSRTSDERQPKKPECSLPSSPIAGKRSPSTVPKTSNSPSPTVEDKTTSQDISTQTAIEFVSVLEGCKNHLEVVKEEILALKTRCQSQHEDTLKLAGALDSLVYRVGTQEPKVEKLETDSHCLGMLISDYEVNFKAIEKHLERHDVKVQEIERAFQRMDRERDGLRADLRTVHEQANYLATVKADKVDVQTELNRRALVTDMQQRIPYAVYNEMVRDLTRTVTQLREELHDLDQNLKTVQYELMKGLASKAATQDVSQIRKQLRGALSRWQRIEKERQATTTAMGDSSSAGVSANADSDASKCLACGIQTTLEGSHTLVGNSFIPANRIRPGVRNAGGPHTKFVPPEKLFRTGSLGVVRKMPQDEKRNDQHWKI